MEPKELVGLMTTKAEAVQAVVSPIRSAGDACRYAVDLTRRQDGKTIAAIGFPPEFLDTLRDLCTAEGLELLDQPFREAAGRIHTALTPADWGIAETGTLVLKSSPENVRVATMLSETHVAVLPADRIRADSMDLLDEINDILMTDDASYTAFITGASRTADIERVLAIGVHGPKELHILIVEENGS
jgi:L-lactate dehydrogenase complex protein LldG